MTAITLSPRARKRMIDRGLDALTWLVVARDARARSSGSWPPRCRTTASSRAAATTCCTRPSPPFRDMWKTIDFERYLINSAIICTAAALLATAFASTAGYALARFRFRGAAPVRRWPSSAPS